METFVKEVRFGARALARQPGSAVVSVLILALGIGLTTAMFSVVYGVFFRGLDVPEPDRVAMVFWAVPSGPDSRGLRQVPSQDFQHLRESQRSFEDLAAWWGGTVNLSGTEGPERFQGTFVTANLFDLLEVQPVLGRSFRPGEDAPGNAPTVILGHGVWRDRYGSDPDVLGRTVKVNGEQGTIVGVMREGFMFPSEAEIWVTMDDDPLATERGEGRHYDVVGRLAEGVDVDRAELDIARVASEIARENPDVEEGTTGRVLTFVDTQTGPELKALFGAMMVAVLLVLLVACANVANLLLARAALRTREAGVRVAMGASRTRVMAPFFAEAFVLAAAGAVLGTGLAYQLVAMFDAATATAVTGRPYFIVFQVDLPILAGVVALTLLTALVAGAAPALQVSRTDVNEVLKDDSRGSSSLSLGRLSRGLVVAEVALSCALLVGAGLMTKSIVQLSNHEYPFEPGEYFTARLGLFEADYPEQEDRLAFWDELVRKVEALPDVAEAGLTSSLPGNNTGPRTVRLEGVDYEGDRELPLSQMAVISPGFFELMDAELVEGEPFGPEHATGSEPVAIVNESFAARYWPGQSALGRRFRTGRGEDAPWMRVIGVAPDIQMEGFQPAGSPGATPDGFYMPLAQHDLAFMSLGARVRSGPAMAVAEDVRGVVLEMDPDLPMYDVMDLAGVIEENSWFYSAFGAVFIVFGIAALFMASIGLYGVLAFSVSRRIQEMGIRMALGAGSRDVVGLVMRQGAVQTGIGLVIGLALAWPLSKAVNMITFRVDPADPVVFGGVVAVIALVAVGASLVPAARATSVEPARALRGE